MTEEQIERKAEKMIDVLDDMLMRGKIDQRAYDFAMLSVHEWTEKQYRARLLSHS